MLDVYVVPMVNPDGVYEGNYRMDLNNNNLNRVYNDPSPDLQYFFPNTVTQCLK